VFTLSARRRRVLDALCRAIAPLAFAHPEAGGVPLPAAVEARLAHVDPIIARQAARLLTLFDSSLTALVTRGAARRFSSLDPTTRDRVLASWETSRVPIRRTIFQALRRLILTTWYAMPEALASTGWRGGLAKRLAELEWEGPLPGEPRESEPVLRTRTAHIHMPGERRRSDRIRPGSDVANGSVLRTGVLVIGSGAGGAVVAARLAELGHETLVVEEGSFWEPAELTERESEMMPRLYAGGGMRATDDLSFAVLQGCAVGGSAFVNWLVMLRTPDWVLEEWTREHGAEHLDAAQLAPVFDLIERETHTRVVPDEAHSPANRALLTGARALGWRAGAAAINAEGCIRAGTCGLGCRYDAKRGPASVYLPRALEAGARLITETRVERLEIVERGSAAPLKRVHAVTSDRDGGLHGRVTIEAPLVVLAAGAVGTPALLQRSGLGGPSVGRFLRLHPTTAVVGVYDREMYAAAGIPLSAMCDEFHRGSDGYGFWLECPPLYPAFASAALPGFGAAHRSRMEEFSRLGPIISLVRDGADRLHSSGSVRLDRRGRPRIAYRLSGPDRRAVIRGIQAAARVHLAAGATEAYTLHARGGRVESEHDIERLASLAYGPNRLAMFSAHVNGTARLGTDPRRSSCTPDGGVRGAPGVYVADGSLLPTAPGVNPQETIMAVATIVSRGIDARHSRVRG
jgi:choline dehydrogenase-like flavoprotein